MADDKTIAAAAEALDPLLDGLDDNCRCGGARRGDEDVMATAVVAAVEPLIRVDERAKIAAAIRAETEPLADIDGPVPMGRRTGMQDAARIAEGSR